MYLYWFVLCTVSSFTHALIKFVKRVFIDKLRLNITLNISFLIEPSNQKWGHVSQFFCFIVVHCRFILPWYCLNRIWTELSRIESGVIFTIIVIYPDDESGLIDWTDRIGKSYHPTFLQRQEANIGDRIFEGNMIFYNLNELRYNLF